ncbi:MAG: UPF0149 family protein [Oleiphilaceae bacterium]|nr:UPF0149 family protein [Oleiphilaceae bacterium]
MSQVSPRDTEFDWLANVYNSHAAINHPSELHGLLMGQLAGGERLEPEQWLSQVVEHMGVEQLATDKQPGLLDDLVSFYEHVDDEIAQDSTSFTLFLPDDEYALTERLEALALWVRGFLEGIAIAASERLAQIDEDLQEILRDMVDISQLDERVSASEEAEREFFEICEYVRVGVLNLYAEFNEPSVPEETPPSPTLH